MRKPQAILSLSGSGPGTAQAAGVTLPHPLRAQSGAVVAVQRDSSDLKLNPHLHAVFLDGVYVPAANAAPEFRALPRLSTTDVADALQVARARILRYLERRGVITLDSDAYSDVLCVSEDLAERDLAERDPALAQLAAAAGSGLAPAGPELRRKPRELAFAVRPGMVIDAPLSVREAGLSLHAATRTGPADEQGREALLKFILRLPLANERLLRGPDGLLRIALKKPFSDGTVAVDLGPLSLLCRLVALVPAPRFHTVRYFGVLSPISRRRAPRRRRDGHHAMPLPAHSATGIAPRAHRPAARSAINQLARAQYSLRCRVEISSTTSSASGPSLRASRRHRGTAWSIALACSTVWRRD